MASLSPKNKVRRGGSAFTIFTFGGQPVSFCQQIAHTSPQPVAPPSAIHPMDEPYPVEILTPAAAGMGQLVLNMYELFGQGGRASKVWDRLGATISGGTIASPFGSQSENNSSQNLSLGGDGVFNSGGKQSVDIVDIFLKQAKAKPEELAVVKIIRPFGAGGDVQPYTEEYHGCVVTNVVDGEQIEVGTMEVIKQVTVAYRYLTRNTEPSLGFKYRDGAL